MDMEFAELFVDDVAGIREMSAMAWSIVRECFDPLIGREQNDYMLEMFQSESSIKKQLGEGSRYFFVKDHAGRNVGFTAFYPKGGVLYLSKFYLHKRERGKGYARRIMAFVIGQARSAGLAGIELNVNRNNGARFVYEHLGFRIAREEKKDIGGGFCMDDYVYRLDL